MKLTKDVDVSITRFLEGVVAYIPEEQSANKSTISASADSRLALPLTSYTSSNSLSDSIDAANSKSLPSLEAQKQLSCTTLTAAQFSKSPELRHRSFSEKKKLLIEKSKERYLRRMGTKQEG